MNADGILVYILFVLGFVLLVKGADFLVDGASGIARKFGIPGIVVGLTVVAMGTSLPELVVNLISAFQGKTDIGLGNVIGSNITNILLILGLTAVFCPVVVGRSAAAKDTPFVTAITLLLILLANDFFIGNGVRSLTMVDGLIFLGIMGVYLFHLFSSAGVFNKKQPENVVDEQVTEEVEKCREHPNWLLSLMILGGIIGLCIGGQWVVNGAITIARLFGLSEILISLTIISIGTSLPELVTSVVAAIKKQCDISVGNIVGSNIFNILFILGITVLIHPIPIAPAVNVDLGVALLASGALLLVMFKGGRNLTIEKWEGIAMMLAYIGYLVYVIIRG